MENSNPKPKLTIEEKYERLRIQRLNAVLKWNNSNRDRVQVYQKRYLEKNRDKAISYTKNHLKDEKNKEAYKEYQAGYRITKRLRQMPFFGEEILY